MTVTLKEYLLANDSNRGHDRCQPLRAKCRPQAYGDRRNCHRDVDENADACQNTVRKIAFGNGRSIEIR